tara:strand:- start:752 stop:1999 length:1248 start_codon:yes stop_codon:yes gene_type:complete
MSENLKPQVVPSKDQINAVNSERARIEAFEREKITATNEIYESQETTPEGHKNALKVMQERTLNQIEVNKNYGKVESEFSENTIKPDLNRSKNEEQMRVRDEQLAMNIKQTQNFQKLTEDATTRNHAPNLYEQPMTDNTKNVYKETAVKPQEDYTVQTTNVDPYILQISQPNFNSPFDVIPLPSMGKTYGNRKQNIRVAYMTTADENILTSPNLLQSGEFLSILINRKLLEPQMRYRDLLVGDRNAIMIWLRATGYGEMYPVTLLDENGVAFETEVNLNDLKTKNLGADPDEDGLFPYRFVLTQSDVRFRLLTCGDVDDIDKIIETEKENGVLVNNTSTYVLEKMIVEVNGDRNRGQIKDFVSSIRLKDGKDFTKYLESIECGIDLNITVGTPGGGSVDTFLPLNLGFFWPDFRV